MATHGSNDEQALLKLERALSNQTQLQQDAEASLFKLRKTNLEKLAEVQKEILARNTAERLTREQQINEKLIKMGFTANQIINEKSLKDQLADIDKLAKKRLASAKKPETIKKIKDETEQQKKQAAALDKYKRKLTKKALQDEQKERVEAMSGAFSKTFGYEQFKAISDNISKMKEAGASKSDIKKAIAGGIIGNLSNKLANAMSALASKFDETIEEIAGAKSEIDTRLQGSKGTTKNGSYWDQISTDISKNLGATPLVKQADIVSKLKEYVGKGISFNVEQRAFLQAISDKIATTFNAADASLLKLVRIQQEDTTAARLGMESALTAFLNEMYETTEYMSEMADAVRSNIYEASALMTAKSATEFEYQVQKWMGSLYSVGFNTDLSSALGDLAAGNISSISEGGLGNLLVMAANKASLPIADILSDGLDASDTNKLMQAMVNYLGQIYNETKGSNVLAQQYANVFGLKASDIKAAANLTTSITNIANQNLDYSGLLTQLSNMANTITDRTSLGELMSNALANFSYSTAAGVANSPVLYATYKIADLLDTVVGGIDFSVPLVFGSGTAQTFNVADIMKTGVLGASLLGGIGTMIGGLGNTGEGLLNKFNIFNNEQNIVTRGTGANLLTTNLPTTSESGSMIGNADNSIVKEKTMTEQTDEAKQQTASALEETSETSLKDVDTSVLKIYDLLSPIINASGIKVISGDDTSWGAVIRDNQIY